MTEHLDYRQKLKENVALLVEQLYKEAVVQEKVQKAFQSKDSSSFPRRNEHGTKHPTATRGASKDQRKLKMLACLRPKCKATSQRHPGGVRNCPYASKEEAQKLISSHLAGKSRSTKMIRDKVPSSINTTDTTKMGVTFAGKLHTQLCADGGSDINLLPASTFQSLIAQRADMSVESFPKIQKFSLAASEQFV